MGSLHYLDTAASTQRLIWFVDEDIHCGGHSNVNQRSLQRLSHHFQRFTSSFLATPRYLPWLSTVVLTALHHLVVNLQKPESRWHDALRSIKHLIPHGADMHAVCKGQSCAEIAYASERDGSYAGDVWDAALAAAGRSVRDCRRGSRRPHRACPASRQVTLQTPVTFKMMWDGIHELCPYYWDTLGGNAGQENRLVEGVVSDEWETDSDGD